MRLGHTELHPTRSWVNRREFPKKGTRETDNKDQQAVMVVVVLIVMLMVMLMGGADGDGGDDC